jgi:hypothetical protein
VNDQAELCREARDGDPRFLSILLDCVRRRSALLGLDAPKRLEVEEGVRLELVEEIVEVVPPEPPPSGPLSCNGNGEITGAP